MKSANFYAVMESTSPEYKPEIQKVVEDGSGNIRFIRFRACMQSFSKRNRNGRLWFSKFMKDGLTAPHILELMRMGSLAGENGHPVPGTKEATMERLTTIDPERMCHLIKNFEWNSDDTLVHSTIDTIDDINGPGTKLARNIMQGMVPAFSVRALVPQKKNIDGTMDVTGVGRVITYDRVILPSHEEAYMDKSTPINEIISTPKFDVLMEGFTEFVLERSESVRTVLDGMYPVKESVSINKTGMLSVNTEKQGRVIIPIEKNLSSEINNLLKHL